MKARMVVGLIAAVQATTVCYERSCVGAGLRARSETCYLLTLARLYPLGGLMACCTSSGRWTCVKRCSRFYTIVYQGSRRAVSHECCVIDSFTCDLGLQEGNIISPTLHLFFTDYLLLEVCAKHPGVTLLGLSDKPAGLIVAAMQAAEFIVMCRSLSGVQAVAAAV